MSNCSKLTESSQPPKSQLFSRSVDLSNLRVSLFPHNRAQKKERDVSLLELQELVRNHHSIKSRTKAIREGLKTSKHKTNIKAGLPAVTLSIQITRHNGTRKGIQQGEFVPSGIVQADFDEHDDFDTLYQALKKDPHAVVVFRSPSGKVKAGFRVDPIPTNRGEQRGAFAEIQRYGCETYGGVIDGAPKALNSFCYLAHDPDVYLNLEASALSYTYTPPAQRIQQAIKSEAELTALTIKVTSALNHIDPDAGYQDWLQVGMALHDSDIDDDDALSIWDNWSQRSKDYDSSELEAKWGTFGQGEDNNVDEEGNASEEDDGEDSKVTIGSIFHYALKGGWSPPGHSGKKHYWLAPDPMPAPGESWQDQQEALAEAFDSSASTVLIRADTGVGKDFAKDTHILKGDVSKNRFIEMTTRVELADEKIRNFNKRQSECDVRLKFQRWKSIWHNWETHGKKPWHERKALVGQGLMCCQPGKFEALRAKGIPSPATLCSQCPVEDVCKTRGYRAQPQKAQTADYLITAQDLLFFDPSLAGFAKRIIADKEREVVGVVDEIKAHELFPEYNLSKSELRQMIESWKDTTVEAFARDMIEALEMGGTEPDFDKVKQIVQGLSENEERLIIKAFTQLRFTGEILLSPEYHIIEEGVHLSAGIFRSERFAIPIATTREHQKTLEKMGTPALLPFDLDGNTLVISYQYAIWLGIYNLDLESDEISGIDRFPKLHLNPQWTPLHQLRKLFESYPRPQDAPIRYHNESLIFNLLPQVHPALTQLVMMSATVETETITNKIFADRSVEAVDAKPARWKADNKVFQFKKGRYPRATVLTDGQLNPRGQQILGYIMPYIKPNHAVISYKCLESHFEDKCVFAHFGAAEGENERFLECDTVWVIFDPRLPDYEVRRRAKMIYGRDDEPLNYEYDSATGRYLDERLQAIAESHTTGELIQAIGRARLVRREGVTVVIVTSRDIPGVSGRDQTLLFDWEDWQSAQDFSHLVQIIKEREAHERELEAQVIKLYKDGLTQGEIATELHKGKKWVNQVLKSAEVTDGTFGFASYREYYRQQNQKSHPPETQATTASGDLTIAEKVLEYLEGGPAKTGVIAEHLEVSKTHLNRAINDLLKTGEIVWLRHGVYGLNMTPAVDDGEIIKPRRGFYCLPRQSTDDSISTSHSTSRSSERRTPRVLPADHNDPRHYRFVPYTADPVLPALTHLSAPAGASLSEIIRLATSDVRCERGYQGNVEFLDPADVPRLMRSHVEELGVNPFVPTAKALDAVSEYRWTRLQRLTSKILFNPEKYEELVGPFMDCLMANKGRADPHASKIVSLLVLRTCEGESWWKSILPTVNLKSSMVSLFKLERSAVDCLADIHDDCWVFACLNQALTMHPLIPFIQHVESSTTKSGG